MKDINRRSFLKGAAATASIGAVASVVPAVTAVADEAAADSFPMPVVPGYSCYSDWLGQPPEIDPSEIVATYDTEVLVVGSGHAGTQCALAAAEGGAKVMVLEKQAEDTYSAKGGGFATYNSKFLTGLGFGPYELGEIVAEYCRRGGQTVRPSLVSKYVLNSGEMMDHLVEIIGDKSNIFDYENAKFEVQYAYGNPPASEYPAVLGGFKMWAACLLVMSDYTLEPIFGREKRVGRMTEIELWCREAAKELGAEWFYDTTAVKLVQNEDGDVTGVIASTPEGYVQFNASKAVAMTTGDFAGNSEMLLNLMTLTNEKNLRAFKDDPEALAKLGAGQENGAGHKMMCWAGGYIEDAPRPSLSTYAKGSPFGSAPFLMLNAKGERFMNEAYGPFQRMHYMYEPGIISTITDANYMQTITLPACDHGSPCFGLVSDVNLIGDFENGMETLEAGPEPGKVAGCGSSFKQYYDTWKADTLEELLGYLGYEGEALDTALKSIEAYNELCHGGFDTEFGKDTAAMIPIETPPFYGTKRNETATANETMVTLAGMSTDNNMNVVRADATPIKGLYVAGNTLGNRFGSGYNTPAAGSSIGMALTHGRVPGKYLAAL